MREFEATLPRTEPVEPHPERRPWGYGDILKAIAIVIVGTLIVTVPAALLADSFAEGAIEDDATALSIVLGASLFLELLLLSSAVWFSVRKYNLSWGALGLRWPNRGSFLLPIGLLISGLSIVYLYFTLLSLAGVEPDADLPEEAFHNAGPVVILAVLSLAFAPMMEEIFFRGFIFGGLRGRWGSVLAALASGFLFGLAHIGNPGTLYVIVPIGLVGALFAWGYLYSGSLFPGMVAHFLFNFVSFSIGLAFS